MKSFSGTEMDNAVEICRQVMEELHITKENPIILNLSLIHIFFRAVSSKGFALQEHLQSAPMLY